MISVNRAAWRLFEDLCADADALRIGASPGPHAERLLDAGSHHPGGIEAGLRMAEICMGGLGRVQLISDGTLRRWPWTVTARSSQPVIACLASQLAGWSLKHERFFALGSGPARALARKEALFADLDYADQADAGVLVLESAKPPPPLLLTEIAAACGIAPDRLGIVFAPTQSLAGNVQVVARVLEVALHKAHALHFPLERIRDGLGSAPLSPPHPDFVTAMGRTNDAIIFGGRVHLFVTGAASDAADLANQLPAGTSRDHGRPFAEIFRAAKGDFYAIDPMLFSPAAVSVTAVETGETFHAGRLDPELLDRSFA